MLVLEVIFEQEQQSELLLWKIIRAFSAIENADITNLILPCLSHSKPAIRWETIRTIGLISSGNIKIMNKLKRLQKTQ